MLWRLGHERAENHGAIREGAALIDREAGIKLRIMMTIAHILTGLGGGFVKQGEALDNGVAEIFISRGELNVAQDDALVGAGVERALA